MIDVKKIDIKSTLGMWYQAIENFNGTIERSEAQPFGSVAGRINNKELTIKLIQEIITDIKGCVVDKVGKQNELLLKGEYRVTRTYLANRLGRSCPTIDGILSRLSDAGLILVGDASKKFPNREGRTRCIQIKFVCKSLFILFKDKAKKASNDAYKVIKSFVAGKATKTSNAKTSVADMTSKASSPKHQEHQEHQEKEDEEMFSRVLDNFFGEEKKDPLKAGNG